MPDDTNPTVKFLTDNAFKIVALVTTLAVTVGGGVLTAFLIGAAAWAWSMNEDNVQIKANMTSIARDLREVSSSLKDLNSLEKRVTHIETTRFTDKDASDIKARMDSQDRRIRELEFITKTVRD